MLYPKKKNKNIEHLLNMPGDSELKIRKSLVLCTHGKPYNI
jgi:hypothetical protein